MYLIDMYSISVHPINISQPKLIHPDISGGRPPGALLQGLRRGQRDPTGLAAASGARETTIFYRCEHVNHMEVS